jgi:hypothetical protein
MSLRAPAASRISGRIAHDRRHHGRCGDFELLTEITVSFVIDHSSAVARWSLRPGDCEFFGVSAEIAAQAFVAEKTHAHTERASKQRNIVVLGV